MGNLVSEYKTNHYTRVDTISAEVQTHIKENVLILQEVNNNSRRNYPKVL